MKTYRKTPDQLPLAAVTCMTPARDPKQFLEESSGKNHGQGILEEESGVLQNIWEASWNSYTVEFIQSLSRFIGNPVLVPVPFDWASLVMNLQTSVRAL